MVRYKKVFRGAWHGRIPRWKQIKGWIKGRTNRFPVPGHAFKFSRHSRQAARKALANRRTAGYLGIEHKFWDTAIVAQTIAQPNNCINGRVNIFGSNVISMPPQGDGPSERDGKKWVCESLQIKGSFHTAGVETQGAPADDILIYMAVVLDKQANGANLLSESVFTNPAAVLETNTAVFRNLEFNHRFRVLMAKRVKQKRHHTNEGASNLFASGAHVIPFDEFIPFRRPMEALLSAQTSVIANCVKEAVHVIAFAYCNTSQVIMNANIRLRFQG